MASEGPTQGIGVGGPFIIGENLVKMAAHASLGNDTPAYVSIGASAVIRPNLLEMYEETLQEDPPEAVTQHFE